MNQLTYAGLLNKTITIYGQEGSFPAYEFITKHADKVEGVNAQIYNFRYALASASGLESVALELMKEAIEDNGFWYGYDYLLEDDDLKPLHKYDEFQRLVQLCKEREEKAKASSVPKMELLEQDDSSSLVLTLHGDQENIEITEPFWNSVIDNNFSLACVQSSQIQFSDGYVWDDVQQGTKELEYYYNQLVKEKENIILGGFSAGARVAWNAIVTEQVEVKGFLFVAPWLLDIEEQKQLIAKLKEKNLKGSIICGNKDEDSFECTKKFVELLKQESIPHSFEIIEDLEHEYPKNFKVLLAKGLAFINGEENKDELGS